MNLLRRNTVSPTKFLCWQISRAWEGNGKIEKENIYITKGRVTSGGFFKLDAWVEYSIVQQWTFSRGQCVLSLRNGRRFGLSYSAYSPICRSWYFCPLWWSRLNSLWRYCGKRWIRRMWVHLDNIPFKYTRFELTTCRYSGLSASSSTTLSIY